MLFLSSLDFALSLGPDVTAKNVITKTLAGHFTKSVKQSGISFAYVGPILASRAILLFEFRA